MLGYFVPRPVVEMPNLLFVLDHGIGLVLPFGLRFEVLLDGVEVFAILVERFEERILILERPQFKRTPLFWFSVGRFLVFFCRRRIWKQKKLGQRNRRAHIDRVIR